MEYCEDCHVEIDVEPHPHGVYCNACSARFYAEWEAKQLAEFEKRRQQREPRKTAYASGPLPSGFGMLFRSDLASRDGAACGICGDPLDPFKAHVDHIIPISRGGLHEWENVRLTHPFCNMSKGDRT
jgi:5-methylcytosine-specific restriction endonuclease McrA